MPVEHDSEALAKLHGTSQSPQLVSVRLRPGNAGNNRYAPPLMRRLVRGIKARLPKATVVVRADWQECDRIAFVGFSMSALVTATLLGNDSRVHAGVLMMGAANYADVFATCGDKTAAVREHVMHEFGWTLDQYRDFFHGLFDRADPTHYAGHYDPDKILFIDAMYDDCMPESARATLWEVTGRPERITLLYQHRHAFYSITPLGLNFMRRKIYHFLDAALDTSTDSNPPH